MTERKIKKAKAIVCRLSIKAKTIALRAKNIFNTLKAMKELLLLISTFLSSVTCIKSLFSLALFFSVMMCIIVKAVKAPHIPVKKPPLKLFSV